MLSQNLSRLNSLSSSSVCTTLSCNHHIPLPPPRIGNACVHLQTVISSSHRFSFSPSRRIYTIKNVPKMSSSSVPAVATQTEIPIVVGYGLVTVDFLATVASFPKPDEKMTTTSLKVQGGGNVGNALTCVARLGSKSRLISKVANDPQGKGILEELEADGVDTSFVVVSRGGTSTVSYVIVDVQNKTRTCLYTPIYPPMKPDDLTQSSLVSALDSARILFIDGLVHETAFALAQECRQFARRYQS